MKCNHFLSDSHAPKGSQISEAQNLLSEFPIRLDNAQIASRIECEMILNCHTTDMDEILHAVTNDASQNLFFL